MKIVLLKDIDHVGKKYEVKDVRKGYAKNFLIPKGLAKPATKEFLKWVSLQKEVEAKKSEKELEKVQEAASKIDGYELTIPVKVGDEGQLYESIGAQKIVEELKKNGFEIQKHQIEIDHPLKATGEFPIKIKFKHNLEVEIKVIIVEEK